MVDIQYLDDQDYSVEITSFDNSLPDDVEKIVIENPSGDCSELTRLTNMMNLTQRKLDTVVIRNVTRESPAFLAFFISLSNKTFRLQLGNCWASEALFGCLMGSIMNGLKNLEIRNPHSVPYLIPSRYQMGLLFQAVASSSSLKILDFNACVGLQGEACSTFLRALKNHRSLRSLNLNVNRISAHQQLLRMAFWETELRILVVTTVERNKKLVPLSTLIEGLCRESCTLSALYLTFGFEIDVDFNNISIHNTSLAEMHLERSNLTCDEAVKIAKVCKKLEILSIRDNPISDLVPLDDLLLGEETILEHLHLGNDGISEEMWIEFFEKIPRMKSLKRLAIANEPFVNFGDSFRATFLNALWQNSSLGSIKICKGSDPWAIEVHGEYFRKVSIPLCLNRAGRKALQDISSEQTLPKGLWPHLLERAMALKYFSAGDKWDSPSLTSTRTDAVYWLLREHMIASTIADNSQLE